MPDVLNGGESPTVGTVTEQDRRHRLCSGKQNETRAFSFHIHVLYIDILDNLMFNEKRLMYR